MSGTFTIDTLPGVKIDVSRTPVYATAVQTSIGGKEVRTYFQSTPRYRYSLSIEFLRSPARGAFTTEAQALVDFFDGQIGRYDTFTFYDPLLVETHGRTANAAKTVRFDSDEITFKRFANGFWQVASVDLISVK